MKATCKTCKWWGRSYRGCCDLVGFEDCGSATRMARESAINPHEPARFEILARAADDTDLEARLATGPDFGCILHEPA